MQLRDRLTAKEVQVATLVWQGLTNKDIARVLITSEQVVKNCLRTAFDKLECGRGWNSRCTSPATVERTGMYNWEMGCCQATPGWSGGDEEPTLGKKTEQPAVGGGL